MNLSSLSDLCSLRVYNHTGVDTVRPQRWSFHFRPWCWLMHGDFTRANLWDIPLCTLNHLTSITFCDWTMGRVFLGGEPKSSTRWTFRFSAAEEPFGVWRKTQERRCGSSVFFLKLSGRRNGKNGRNRRRNGKNAGVYIGLYADRWQHVWFL